MITINLEGDKQLFAEFARLSDALKDQTTRRLADAVFKDVRQGADTHTQTGALFRSVRMASEGDGFAIFHDMQAAPHAMFVHWGTKPHTIKPKDKKALRWPAGGGFVFAKSVEHPGYEGDPYLVKAAEDAPRHFNEIIKTLEF